MVKEAYEKLAAIYKRRQQGEQDESESPTEMTEADIMEEL